MTVRIGLLGSGFVSNFYMLGLQDVAGWEMPVVASPDGLHARQFAEKWKIPEAATDIEEVISRKDLNLIILGVPNQFHKELAIRCAQAGKHVVCTKPLGRNRLEARAMLEAAQAAGVLHGYAETEVFSPAVMKARTLIERGALGKVLTVRAREAHSGPHAGWFRDKELAGGGAMLDMGCHTIEAARYFIGKDNPIVEVMAWTGRLGIPPLTGGARSDGGGARRDEKGGEAVSGSDIGGPDGEVEDNAVLLMRFEGGQLAQAELSWTACGGLDLRNEVYGTEGVIFTDVTRETPIKVFSRPGAGYVVEKGEAETGWLFPPVDEAWTYGYREEMRHFVECVANERMPRETFADGCVVNCILDAAYCSAQAKRWERVEYD